MRSKLVRVSMVAFALCISAVLWTSTKTYAIGGGGLVLCPYWNIYCLDVWDPVICSNGQVYSNDCYALRACQFDCVPWGGFLY